MVVRIDRKEGFGHFKFNRDLFLGLRKANSSTLVICSKDMETLWESPESKVYSFVVINDLLIYSIYRGKTVARNLKNLEVEVYSYPYPLLLSNDEISNGYFVGNVKGVGFLKFDLNNGALVELYKNERINHSIKQLNGKILSYNSEKLFSYNSKMSIAWQLDISDLCAYDVGDGLEKAELSNIYSDDEFVYLLAGLSVVKASIQSGEIIWHTKLNTAQSRGLIHDGYLYTTSNAYINKIDCQTGKILYQVGFDYIFIDNERDLGPIMEFVWYKDSIWTVMDSNPSALIEINPNDGSYKSVIPLKDLGIARDCHMPRFHDNRMYILDFDNTLHIFEMS